jgi:hypothetical protein
MFATMSEATAVMGRLRRLALAAAASDDATTRADAAALEGALAGLTPLAEALGLAAVRGRSTLADRDGEIRGAQLFVAEGILAAAAAIAEALHDTVDGKIRPQDGPEATRAWRRIIGLNKGRALSRHQVYNVLRGQRCGRNL